MCFNISKGNKKGVAEAKYLNHFKAYTIYELRTRMTYVASRKLIKEEGYSSLINADRRHAAH